MFSQHAARVHVPDGSPVEEAFARTTHLGIGAHQDDLEIMAIHGILECYGRSDAAFAGVTVTNGWGAPRSGPFASIAGETLGRLRDEEQQQAADNGRYSAQVLLAHESAAVKEPANSALRGDLERIFQLARPSTVYTHNLADKHDTHVALALRVVECLRALPADRRPERLLGCEVWRDLDWLTGEGRVELAAHGHEHLQAALIGVFHSQIAGGKRYDLAAMGRRRAHATFSESHAVDSSEGIVLAMDLSPLMRSESLGVEEFVENQLARFTGDVLSRLRRFGSGGVS